MQVSTMRQFTPKLAEVYRNLDAQGKRLEVIFISSDQSEAQFKVRQLRSFLLIIISQACH